MLTLGLCVAALPAAQARVPAKVQTLGACGFDRSRLTFRGDGQAQSRCLLRTIHPWGRVAAESAPIPSTLAERIGRPAAHLKTPLRRLLQGMGMAESAVGGSLDAPLSRAGTASARQAVARYFVIHDTSWPWLGGADFPPDASAALNDLTPFDRPDAPAHVFVNRLGQALTTHDFSVPWRATKLETRGVGDASKGRFLHIELLQPRRQHVDGPPGNDAIAPQPGFTAAQYDTLALLYVAASVRGGHWMVPALHGAIDEGLPEGHDDPQNFELDRFADAVARLTARLDGLATPPRRTGHRAAGCPGRTACG